MLQEIIFPQEQEFLINLILQRPEQFIALGGEQVLKNSLERNNRQLLIDYLEQNNLTQQYIDTTISTIKDETIELRNAIADANLDKIISIGTGNGILETFLLSEGLTSEILLIDIEDNNNEVYEFSREGYGCANLADTKSFILNNVPSANIQTLNSSEVELPDFEFTLLISSFAMGFNFPCNDYVNFIKKNATIDALVIFDKIKETTDIGATYLLTNFTVRNKFAGNESDRLFLHSIYGSPP